MANIDEIYIIKVSRTIEDRDKVLKSFYMATGDAELAAERYNSVSDTVLNESSYNRLDLYKLNTKDNPAQLLEYCLVNAINDNIKNILNLKYCELQAFKEI